jgi:signal transduction histidine kinase
MCCKTAAVSAGRFRQGHRVANGKASYSFLPHILPIRDAGARLADGVAEDITRFRLLDGVKSNLVATVSHELKTPGEHPAGASSSLEETIGPRRQATRMLIDARDSRRLLVMINNLPTPRLEQGKVAPSAPGRPLVLLQSASESFQPRRGSGIKLDAAAICRLWPSMWTNSSTLCICSTTPSSTHQGGQISFPPAWRR